MSVVVVDIGCASWGGDQSIAPLLAMYEPDNFYGFDPALDADPRVLVNTTQSVPSEYLDRVELSASAAWLWDGLQRFEVADLGGAVNPRGLKVPCFDLARWLQRFDGDNLIVKLDCEGAEYQLLPALRATGADLLIHTLLVEWHCMACRFGILTEDWTHPEGCVQDPDQWIYNRMLHEQMVRCDVERWNR